MVKILTATVLAILLTADEYRPKVYIGSDLALRCNEETGLVETFVAMKMLLSWHLR